MLNMFINDKNKRRMLIPNAAKEYPIYGESGRNENNLSRQVDGAFAICYCSGCLLKYEKMLPFFLFWLLEPFDSMSEEELWVDLDEFRGLNDPMNDSCFFLFIYEVSCFYVNSF